MGSSESTSGYRVIHVLESSPAAQAGLISFLDFIVSVNGINLSIDNTLSKIISKSLDCKVMLKVFNIVTEEFRDVQILPSNSWGGEGLIGASVRWENWKNCEGLRILEVLPNSHAQKIGLIPKKDYILGTENFSINDVDTFEKVIKEHKKFSLYVFSSTTGKVRILRVENCKELGCTVGEGMINSIKSIEYENDEKVDEEKVVVTVLKKSNNETVPVSVPPPPPPPPPPPQPQKLSMQTSNENMKDKDIRTVYILPPPSIYDLSMESLTFQPKIMSSKYVRIP